MPPSQLIGFLGVLAIAACWALAVVLFRVGTPGSVARMLSILLLVEGITLATAGFPEMMLVESLDAFFGQHPTYAHLGFIAHTMGDAAMLALYPPFLAAALQTKLTRPFAGKRARMGLWIAAVALVLSVLLSSQDVGATILYVALSLLFGYAFVASIHAWYVSAPGGARDRARIFAIAFGIRDICWGICYLSGIWMIWIGTYFTDYESEFGRTMLIIYAFGTLFAIPVIAYGILRSHLFDIDLRIRWTIKQSTLATTVVTFVFLISEGADRLLSAELGNVAGLGAAAVVVFFLAPLQRFAENVASVAMPNTENTPEYAAHRKMQVYEEAIVEAQREGGISDKERSLLNMLRDSLGIASSDAEMLERELQTSQT